MEKGINEITGKLMDAAVGIDALGSTFFDKTVALLEESWLEIGECAVIEHAGEIGEVLDALHEECKSAVQALLDVLTYLGKE